MQIIHYGLRFSGNIWLSLLSQNDSCKIPPFWHQNLLISFLICLNVIVVLIKVKVNRLSISGRSLQDKWRHQHLNSRDSAFQNGDRFQVLTDFNGREDMTHNLDDVWQIWISCNNSFLPHFRMIYIFICRQTKFDKNSMVYLMYMFNL
jgi:hypothetical protein